MDQLTDLKAILHSKRANIYLLEHCCVMQKDGRVLYLTEAKDENHYLNILIGGLENSDMHIYKTIQVNRRTGGLENCSAGLDGLGVVGCRTGGLEIKPHLKKDLFKVSRRTGGFKGKITSEERNIFSIHKYLFSIKFNFKKSFRSN